MAQASRVYTIRTRYRQPRDFEVVIFFFAVACIPYR